MTTKSATTPNDASRWNSLSARLTSVLTQGDVWFILLAMIILGSVLNPLFYSPVNIENLLRQSTLVGIMTIGQFFVLITAGFDLSVGSVLALSSMLVANFSGQGQYGLAYALLAGALIGLTNGLVITKARIPPFIATIGMMGVARGLSFAVKDQSVMVSNPVFHELDKISVGPIPLPTIVWLAIAIIAFAFLSGSRTSVHMYAIGGNESTARLAGINVTRIKLLVYTVSGLLAAIAGVLFVSRSGSGMPHVAQGWEMHTIAAAVIGGTNLFGGEGNLAKAMGGVMIYMMVRNIMNLVGLDPFFQDIMQGTIILLAVGWRVAQVSRK
jgi:ribose transport system permease protein